MQLCHLNQRGSTGGVPFNMPAKFRILLACKLWLNYASTCLVHHSVFENVPSVLHAEVCHV
jgi:hypothetical protein